MMAVGVFLVSDVGIGTLLAPKVAIRSAAGRACNTSDRRSIHALASPVKSQRR